MALKDWKKSKEDKWKKQDIYLSIKNYNEKYQIFVVHSNTDLLYDYNSIKSFNTKPQALKYAKAYMRKH